MSDEEQDLTVDDINIKNDKPLETPKPLKPKYHYMDSIKIIVGFYKGSIGKILDYVIDMTANYPVGEVRYLVRINNKDIWFLETVIEKLDK